MASDEMLEIKISLTKLTVQSDINTTRLEEVEKKLKENTDLIIAINGLTHEVKYMREDVNEITKRVDKIDNKESEMWAKFKWVVLVAVVGVLVGFIAKTTGLK